MYKVLKLNNISPQGLEKFAGDRYEVASDFTSPDAIIMRSYKLKVDEIPASIKAIAQEQIEQGIEASRIIIIGFSQGGAVAYELALTSSLGFSGVACMSTYLPRKLTAEQCKADKSLDMLVIHGTQDDVVPCELGENSVSHLKELGYEPKWSSFPMAHEVSLQSLSILGEWITGQLNGRN